MAQFLGDIAFIFEMGLLAAGLYLLHSAKEKSLPLILAAAVLIGTGVLGAACTGYYWIRYQAQGEFDYAYPQTNMQQHMQEMMRGGGMMNRQMGPGMQMPPQGGAEDMGGVDTPEQAPQGHDHEPRQ